MIPLNGSGSSGTGRRIRAVYIISLVLLANYVMLDISRTGAGATLTVGEGKEYPGISDALNHAMSGDVIEVYDGTYKEIILVGMSGIDLIANGTVYLEPISQEDPVMEINSAGTSLSGFTINGTIMVKANNTMFHDITFDVKDRTAVHLDSVGDTTFVNVTFAHDNCTGINAVNSSLIRVSDSEFNQLDGNTSIDLHGSSFLNLNRTLLHGNGTGIRSTGSHNITVTGTTFESEGWVLDLLDSHNISIGSSVLNSTDNHAGQLKNCSGLDLFGSDLLLENSTGYLFLNCTGVLFRELEISIEGPASKGMELRNCSGITLESLNVSVPGMGSTAFTLRAGKDLEVRNTTVEVQGDLSYGMRHIDMMGSLVRNSTFRLVGDGSTGAEWIGGTLHTIQDSNFQVVGDDSTGACLKDLFVQIPPPLLNNSYQISGQGGKGIEMVSSTLELKDQSFELTGLDQIGASIISSSLSSLVDSDVTISGQSSTGVVCSDLFDLTISNSTMDISGYGSMGVVSRDFSGFHLHDVEITSTSDVVALEFEMGDELTVIGSTVSSTGTAVSLLHTNASVTNSEITGEPALEVWGSDLLSVNSSYRSTLDWIQAGNTTVPYSRDSSVMVKDCQLSGNVDVGIGASIFIAHTIMFDIRDSNGDPYPSVEVEVKDGDEIRYSTPHFGGAHPVSDSAGSIGPMTAINVTYMDSPDPLWNHTTIRCRREGTAATWDGNYTVPTNETATVRIDAPDIDYPAIPVGLRVIPLVDNEGFLLYWDRNTDDTIGYWVYWLNDTRKWDKLVELGDVSSWDTGRLGPSVTRYYSISAWDGTWNSSRSLSIGNTTYDKTSPAVPGNLWVSHLWPDSVEIAWDHPLDNDIREYVIEMNLTPVGDSFREVHRARPDEGSFIIPDLVPGTRYWFRIQAIDTSLNPSGFSDPISVVLPFETVDIFVIVYYGSEGELAGQPCSGGNVSIMEGGITMMTGQTDDNGTIKFTVEVKGEALIRIRAEPSRFAGTSGESDGYLPFETPDFNLSDISELLRLNLTLPYHVIDKIGVVIARVNYTAGEKDPGPASGANVTLLDKGGDTVEWKKTDYNGEAHFHLLELPFEGYIMAHPPSIYEGKEGEKSGYLPKRSENFTLTNLDPDRGTIYLDLEYHEYVPPPFSLNMTFYPTGENIPLATPIMINFNQPVDTASIELAFSANPPLRDADFRWSNSDMTLTVEHGGFLTETEYTITIGEGAMSKSGTGFPSGYTGNRWTFNTGKEDETGDESDDGIPREVLYIGIGLIVILFIVLVLFLFSRRRDYEEEGEEDYEDVYDDELDVYDEFPETYGDDFEPDLFPEDMVEDIPLMEEEEEEMEEFEEMEELEDIPLMEEEEEEMEEFEEMEELEDIPLMEEEEEEMEEEV